MQEAAQEVSKSIQGKKALGPEPDDHKEPDNKKEAQAIQ